LLLLYAKFLAVLISNTDSNMNSALEIKYVWRRPDIV